MVVMWLYKLGGKLNVYYEVDMKSVVFVVYIYGKKFVVVEFLILMMLFFVYIFEVLQLMIDVEFLNGIN